jgi:hypothetical protein
VKRIAGGRRADDTSRQIAAAGSAGPGSLSAADQPDGDGSDPVLEMGIFLPNRSRVVENVVEKTGV